MKQIKKIMWLPLYELFCSKIMYRNLKLNYDLPHDILYDKLEDEISFTQVEILNLL